MLDELEEFFSECIYFSNSSKINFLEYTLNLQAKEYIIPSSLYSDLENILICVEVGPATLHSLQTFYTFCLFRTGVRGTIQLLASRIEYGNSLTFLTLLTLLTLLMLLAL